MNENRNWYAVLADADDNDWGTGSFEWNEAVEMCKDRGYQLIAEIDGNYDDDGNATSDPICVAVYTAGLDF